MAALFLHFFVWSPRTGFYSYRVTNITWLRGNALPLKNDTRGAKTLGNRANFQRATTFACYISEFLESWQACRVAGWNSISTANVARSYVCTHAYGASADHERGHSNFAKGACTRGMEKRWRQRRASECKVALRSRAGRPTGWPHFYWPSLRSGETISQSTSWAGQTQIDPPGCYEHEKIREPQSACLLSPTGGEVGQRAPLFAAHANCIPTLHFFVHIVVMLTHSCIFSGR
jgi:hypothetical protein